MCRAIDTHIGMVFLALLHNRKHPHSHCHCRRLTVTVTATEEQPLDFPAVVVAGGMVDRSSSGWLPPAWTVEERVRNNGLTMKPTLSVSMDQSSSSDAIANDQQIPNPACAGKSMPMSISEHISSCTDGAALGKHLPESAQTKHEAEKVQNGQHKCKHKKEINLPRRASKRLAGIKVDPVPELKTSNRVRRVAVKEAGEGEVMTNADKSLNFSPNGAAKRIGAVEGGSDTKCKFDSATNTMEFGQCEYSNWKLAAAEKLPEKSVEEHGSDKDQQCFSFLPQQNQATLKEHVRIFENGDKIDAKSDYSLDLPLGDLLTDPCIAFAIQTLTGVTFESYKNNQISSKSKKFKHFETSAAAEVNNNEIKVQKMGDEKEECNVFSPPEKSTILKEHAADAGIGVKANDNSGSSSEMPIGISWMDPCIEFAIKTLTDCGTVPIRHSSKF